MHGFDPCILEYLVINVRREIALQSHHGFPMAFFKAGSQKTIMAAISLLSVGFLMSGLEAVTGTVLSLAYIHTYIYIYTPPLTFSAGLVRLLYGVVWL